MEQPKVIFTNGAALNDPFINRIIIVDSDLKCLNFMSKFFRYSQCSITQLTKTQDAFEYICDKGGAIDLVIIDVADSEVSNLRLFQQLKNNKDLEHVCVMLQVPNNCYNIDRRFASADGYIYKPCKSTAAFRSIKRIIAKQ